jgi:hypothetical protein
MAGWPASSIPYWDFDRECEARTVFHGSIRGNVIQGTYETTFRGTHQTSARQMAGGQGGAGDQMTASVPDQSGLHALFCPRSIAVVGVSQQHIGPRPKGARAPSRIRLPRLVVSHYENG